MNINRNFASIEQITGTYLSNQNTRTDSGKQVNDISFEKILEQKAKGVEDDKGELKFSKHASLRLEQRSINLNEEQLLRLNEATKKAEEKGIRESLMLMDDMAFIVNVKNNTVITAIDQKDNNDNVFTNIDGAVIA